MDEGLIVPIWKRKVDVHDQGKYRGITTQPTTETVVEGFRRSDQKSRR